MEIKRVCALYFSATGNTEKTVATFAETLAEQLGVPWERLPFTKPAERERDYMFADTDLVVVGTPTYAGKLPNKILPDLKARLHGNGALAAAIVTFGNRSYDNALAELCAVLEGDGFHTVAGGAFVGRHAFTDKLAEDRPDWDDRKELKKFATAIADKVKNLTENPAPVTVPGDPEAPYYIPKGTAGEPAKMSELLALNIFNTFYGRTGWEGVGQAKAVIFFILVVGIGLLQLRATRSKEVQQ